MVASDRAWCPPGWSRREYAHRGHAHTYYVVGERRWRRRPSVMLISEFPGINDHLVRLADTLAADFRVVVPSILGSDGSPTYASGLHQILCVRRELHLLARNSISRSVDWLRDFGDDVVGIGGRRWGVIGMCFTGGFALALAVDPSVAAAVVAQPTAPARASSLGLSRADRRALAAREDLCVRGYRFDGDTASPPAKLEAAERLLGRGRMQAFTLPPTGPRAHSTLTGPQRSDKAVAEVHAFLRERLR